MSEAEFVFPAGEFTTVLANSSLLELGTHRDLNVGVHLTEGFGVVSELAAQRTDDKVSRHVRS